MFNVEDRAAVQARLLELAALDARVVAAAVIGSGAWGEADRFSDIDLGFGVSGPLPPVIDSWTARMYDSFSAVHHWDLTSGASLYRVFLLPGWLEVDLSFTPAESFGPRGPAFRVVFGQTHESAPAPQPSPDAGMAWHHLWHARVSLERFRWWQAEHWIGAARGQIVALACARLGHPVAYARGAHLLPESVTRPLEATLVRFLDPAELRRALAATAGALAAELSISDPALAARLNPMLEELA
jgi:hypothetical protein